MRTSSSGTSCLNTPDVSFNYGDALSASSCGWVDVSKQIDVGFYSNTSLSSGQNYALMTPVVDEKNLYGYNLTNHWAYSAIANRALGKAVNSGSQTSNVNNSTLLAENQSSLLGLQAISPTTARDTNSYRPQLTTSYRRKGDAFTDVVQYKGVNDPGTNTETPFSGSTAIDASTIRTQAGINSAITRTGQPNSLYSFGRPFKLKDISKVDNYHYLYREISDKY
jgi:hypothetical protein